MSGASIRHRWAIPPPVRQPTAVGNNLPYWNGEVDCCINAFTLANGAWLSVDVSHLARWFLNLRIADGGWNCEWANGSVQSSLHSTLNVLKGLLLYEMATGGSDELLAARRTGEEYLLQRHLMYWLSTGAVVGLWIQRLAYPFRLCYSVLNAADYFRTAALHSGPSSGRRDGQYTFCPPARRHMGPTTSPPRASVVRGGCPAGATIEVAYVPEHPRSGVVGRSSYLLRTSRNAVTCRPVAASGRRQPSISEGYVQPAADSLHLRQ